MHGVDEFGASTGVLMLLPIKLIKFNSGDITAKQRYNAMLAVFKAASATCINAGKGPLRKSVSEIAFKVLKIIRPATPTAITL